MGIYQYLELILFASILPGRDFDNLFLPVDQSEKFFEASKKGNLIPLYRTVFSDQLTPVLAYRCLVKEDDRDAPSFLFESVEPGLQVSSVVRSSVLHLHLFVFLIIKHVLLVTSVL